MPDNQKLHYIVATGIVIKDGKYLITKRSPREKAFPNMWTVPGGKLETHDYIHLPKPSKSPQWYNVLELLVKREVSEEVGLKIKNVRYLTDLVFIRPDKIPVVTFSYYADWQSGKVKLDKDSIDFAWVTTREARKYPLIEGIWDELYMLDKVLKGQKTKWRKRK